jgi:conjugal transfer pilus assembly protein TraB
MSDVSEEVSSKAEAPKDIYRKQKIILASIAGAGVLAVGMGVLFGGSGAAPAPITVAAKSDVYDVTKRVSDKNFWYYQSEQTLKKAQKQAKDAEDKVFENTSAIDEQNKKMQTALLETDKNLERKIDELREKIQQLEAAPRFVDREAISSPKSGPKSFDEPFSMGTVNNLSGNVQMPETNPAPSFIFTDDLALSESAVDLYTPETYIPSGSYVSGILLNGVDVSVGLEGQQSPTPILIRLTNKGSLPNGFSSNMKSCRMIATAYGDASSERAKVRVERLSCVSFDGNIVETDVNGYVVDSSGKEGIRGKLITRDGELLQQGFLAATMSGLGQSISDASQTTSISALGTTKSINSGDSVKQALGSGTSSAFDMLAKYAIKRMERLQPVIQIPAGKKVEVVFNSGSEFGAKKTKTKITKVVDSSKNNSLDDIFNGGGIN